MLLKFHGLWLLNFSYFRGRSLNIFRAIYRCLWPLLLNISLLEGRWFLFLDQSLIYFHYFVFKLKVFFIGLLFFIRGTALFSFISLPVPRSLISSFGLHSLLVFVTLDKLKNLGSCYNIRLVIILFLSNLFAGRWLSLVAPEEHSLFKYLIWADIFYLSFFNLFLSSLIEHPLQRQNKAQN